MTLARPSFQLTFDNHTSATIAVLLTPATRTQDKIPRVVETESVTKRKKVVRRR